MNTNIPEATESWSDWSESWEKAKEYNGTQIPTAQLSGRIQEVLALWKKPLPSKWIRQDSWSYLQTKGYRRTDSERPTPEHFLEISLFKMAAWPVTGLGSEVIFLPILNAVSLAYTDTKQREIDVLGILKFPGHSIPCSVEMKGATTNSAWFAVVENLQHLKLIQNLPQDFLPHESPFDDFSTITWSNAWGMVLAPLSFFTSKGKRINSCRQAKELIESVKRELGVTILLAPFSIDVIFDPIS